MGWFSKKKKPVEVKETDLPTYILSNYRRKADERKADAAQALQEVQSPYVPRRS